VLLRHLGDRLFSSRQDGHRSKKMLVKCELRFRLEGGYYVLLLLGPSFCAKKPVASLLAQVPELTKPSRKALTLGGISNAETPAVRKTSARAVVL
jgi:hypothetical protein